MLNNVLHICFADDDEDDHLIFSIALGEIDKYVHLKTFFHSDARMEYLTGENCIFPNLIFLDYNMTGHTGIECLKLIKQTTYLSHIPTLIYSTSLSTMNREKSLLQGTYKCMIKPHRFAELKSDLQQVILKYEMNTR